MRAVTNPNDTDKPIEITRAEVARLAKTGCGTCNGAGCIAFAVKAERGQLKANAPWSLCRCVGKLFMGRLDVRDLGGRLHWMPRAGAVDADALRRAQEWRAETDRAAIVHDIAHAGPQPCGFTWKGKAGVRRACALAVHDVDAPHCDASGWSAWDPARTQTNAVQQHAPARSVYEESEA